MPTIESLIPESGVGFVTNNRTNDSHYLTQAVHDLVIAIAESWYEQHPDVPISIGQCSHKRGGNFPPHHQHKLGVEADVRPFRKDGHDLPVTYQSPVYDRDLTREFVKLVRAKAHMYRIFFNDHVLRTEMLTSHALGHDNHLHLWFDTASLPRVLRIGMTGEDVRRVKVRLTSLAFLSEEDVDDNFDAKTEGAVEGFQILRKLKVDGIAGPATQKELFG